MICRIEKPKKKPIDFASVVEYKSEDNDDGDLISVSIGIGSFSNSWILYVGFSYHMCPNRNRFDTYTSKHGNSV